MFKDRSKGLYVFWIGANDYLYEKQTNLEDIASKATKNIAWTINKLIALGAQNFLIINSDELWKTPYSIKNKDLVRLKKLVALHNAKLVDAIKEIQAQHPNIKFTSFDLNHMFNDLMDHPDKYNQIYGTHIRNVTSACLQVDHAYFDTSRKPIKTSTPCSNPAEYMFWDPEHMSDAFHTILGKMVIEKLDKVYS